MKRIFYLLLSLLGIGSVGCGPLEEVEAEAPMYAAPYSQFHHSSRVDIDTQVVDSDDDTSATEEE